MTKFKKLKKIANIAGYVLVGFFVLFILVTITAKFPLADHRLLTVLTGSMEPKIKTGSVVLIKGASDYKIGDIITFHGTQKLPTTHRIVGIAKDDSVTQYITKGDANNAPDMEKVNPNQILGKALFAIPYLGYATSAIQKPLGFALMIIFPALLIILGEILNIQKEVKKIIQEKKEKNQIPNLKTVPIPKTSRSKQIIPGLIFILLSASFIILHKIPGTNAYFSDQAKIEGCQISTWVEEPVEAGDVIINEVMWMGSRDNDGTGHTADEWIELKNTTDKDIYDISKWRIDGAAGSGGYLEIPDGCSIPANGYFLIANYNKDDSAINVGVDFKDTAMSLNNNYSDNGALVLKDKDGNVIDSTPTPTDANWPAGTNTTDKKQSMEKDTKGQTWHTCDITSMTTTEVSTMQSYWDSNAQDHNCGTPKYNNLSLNDSSIVNKPKQNSEQPLETNLEISDSAPASAEDTTNSILNSASDSAPGDDNNPLIIAGDSAPATQLEIIKEDDGDENKDENSKSEPPIIENKGDEDENNGGNEVIVNPDSPNTPASETTTDQIEQSDSEENKETSMDTPTKSPEENAGATDDSSNSSGEMTSEPEGSEPSESKEESSPIQNNDTQTENPPSDTSNNNL